MTLWLLCAAYEREIFNSLVFVGIPLLKQSFDLVSLDSSWAEIDFVYVKYWICSTSLRLSWNDKCANKDGLELHQSKIMIFCLYEIGCYGEVTLYPMNLS